MLQVSQFDVKTGKPIQVAIDGRWQPAVKQIEHSYLEHWCHTNGINTKERFSVASFYEGINDSDRLRLESEGKYLVFSSGSEGYFTDFEAAQLMTLGNQTTEPIYAANQDAAHYSVAYGGLIASDGVASTVLSSARILVIDDEGRRHGSEPLADRDGQLLSDSQLTRLYDKMGDGTMLVSDRTMRALQTPEERERIALSAASQSKVSGDISALLKDVGRVDAVINVIEAQESKLSRRSVYQFRAASPDLPGIAKGTVSSSQWCERLGIDAIIALNDIKGADSRLTKLGLQDVSNFWLNRKSTAQYRKQTVGLQVKNTIPEATRLEINPLIQKEAQQLAQASASYEKTCQRYLRQKAQEQLRPFQETEGEELQESRPDWLYSALSSDKYNQLADQANVVRGLQYYVQGEWKRLATNGTSVPSAMAQHHSQLKPWEVCNKDLPHGAIVAYYRSPFPNVSAAAIAINNTEVIREQDREAFSKQGVAYLPPSTAKNVAITDFDGDANGFFVGYESTDRNLPNQMREALSGTDSLSSEQQYEAGRALIEKMIYQAEQGQSRPLTPSAYPLATKEFIERTAPDVRPPQIIKQRKEKHPWQDGESHAAATWRAWGITANNPTGKVANAGMSLQALSLELRYAPKELREGLLRQVSSHCAELLTKADKGEIIIPNDDWLDAQGFSPFYRERLEKLSAANTILQGYRDTQKRKGFVEVALKEASALLSEVANGPNAVNLQTAVDTAKSAKGIDLDLHEFIQALQYKPDALRHSKNDASVYIGSKQMLTTLEEPGSWGVQLVNEQYSSAQLQERQNDSFQAIFPKGETRQQTLQAKTIVQTSNGLVKRAVQNKARARQRLLEDQKPTVQVKLLDGRQLTLHSIEDADGKFPWRSDGVHPNWRIAITKDESAKAIARRFRAKLEFTDEQGRAQVEPMGFVTQKCAEQYNLAQKVRPGRRLVIASPQLTMQVPWAQQNDSDMLYAQRERYLTQALAPPEGKDSQLHAQAMAQSLWRQSLGGRKLVMQMYPDILRDRLQLAPQLVLTRLQINPLERAQLINQKVHTVQFGVDEFTKKGKAALLPSVSVLTPTGRQLVGAVYERDIALPEGATYMAALSASKSEKAIHVEIMALPTIEQTPAQIAALKEGRRHLTFDYEPYAAYGVREGDIVLARAEPNGEQIALRVGGQHVINEQLMAKPTAAQRWAEAEGATLSALYQQLTAAKDRGKTLMGLNVEVLGTYERGQIRPFEQLAVAEQKTRPVPSASQAVHQGSAHQGDNVGEDLSIAISAFRDNLSKKEVYQLIAKNSEKAKSLYKTEGSTRAANYVSTVVKSASRKASRVRSTSKGVEI